MAPFLSLSNTIFLAGGASTGDIIKKFRSLFKTIDDVRSAFQQYDVDKDGNISK